MRRDSEGPSSELTAPHRALIRIIQEIGFEVVAEYPAGPYTLDCYLPEFHAGVEADGPGHSKKRDAKRDGVLCDLGIPVLRLGTALIESEPDDARKMVVDFAQDFQENVAARREIARKYERTYDAR